MRVENPLVQQPLIESQKPIEKKELTNSVPHDGDYQDDSSLPFISPFGSSGTYSLSTLRAAVDYHAKFLTVAQNNLEAVNHPAVIPQMILDRLSVR